MSITTDRRRREVGAYAVAHGAEAAAREFGVSAHLADAWASVYGSPEKTETEEPNLELILGHKLERSEGHGPAAARVVAVPPQRPPLRPVPASRPAPAGVPSPGSAPVDSLQYRLAMFLRQRFEQLWGLGPAQTEGDAPSLSGR